jgi:hypothetical protein
MLACRAAERVAFTPSLHHRPKDENVFASDPISRWLGVTVKSSLV